MARLVIFGAGDIARLAHFYFRTDSPHEVVAFAVDAAYRTADTFDGLPLCDAESLAGRYPPDTHEAFVALSYAKMNRVREQKCDALQARGYRLASYVSSRCTYLAPEPPGENAFILEDNTIQPFVTIGRNVTLWSGNHIGHDSTIGDHCFIASHVVVSGHVHVGPGCFIGVNATLRNGITIGERSLLAAGALVMKDTAPGSVHLAARGAVSPLTSDEVQL